MTRSPGRITTTAAHLAGAAAVCAVLLFLFGLTIPTSEEFPDTLAESFHTFFVGAVVGDDDRLPEENTPNWLDEVRPGDVLFMSKGRTPWGMWTHVAMVVRAPEGSPRDTRWVEPGELAVLDAGIHWGMYLAPLSGFADWPRLVVRRASEDPEVGERMARVALEHLDRVFAGVTLGKAPYSNCTKSVVDALASEGFDAGISGWWVPDELWRSDVWLDE